MAKQHRALTTVPTIMRLSLFTLFFALPAAYAAVPPLKQAIRSEEVCGPESGGLLDACASTADCCGSFVCLSPPDETFGVCLMTHFLFVTLVTELNAVLRVSTSKVDRCGNVDTGKVWVTVTPGLYAFTRLARCIHPWTIVRCVQLYVRVVSFKSGSDKGQDPLDTPIFQLPLRSLDKHTVPGPSEARGEMAIRRRQTGERVVDGETSSFKLQLQRVGMTHATEESTCISDRGRRPEGGLPGVFQRQSRFGRHDTRVKV